MRLPITCILLGFVLFGPMPSSADDAGPTHSRLSEILGELSWGQGLNAVFSQVEKQLEAEWKEKLNILDTIGVDRLKAKARDTFKQIKSSVVRFDASTTGYESSVLGPEILAGRNEAMLKLGSGRNEKYFFFRDNQLWKVVVVRDATRAGDFAGFLSQLKSTFGKPAKLVFGEIQGKKTMTGAEWSDSESTVSVSDQRLFFNAYVIRFLQTGIGETLQAERANRKPAPSQATSADPALNELFANDGAAESDDNVVDRLTGQEHTLDLESGRPSYQPVMPTAPGVVAPAANSRASDKKKSEKKTKTAPKKRPKPVEKSGIVF